MIDKSTHKCGIMCHTWATLSVYRQSKGLSFNETFFQKGFLVSSLVGQTFVVFCRYYVLGCDVGLVMVMLFKDEFTV